MNFAMRDVGQVRPLPLARVIGFVDGISEAKQLFLKHFQTRIRRQSLCLQKIARVKGPAIIVHVTLSIVHGRVAVKIVKIGKR
jgi:hypothetical protein